MGLVSMGNSQRVLASPVGSLTKGITMKQCKTEGCTDTELVYSGVDAFLLGVETETWCYPCANALAKQAQA